jgi:hypothetical protein
MPEATHSPDIQGVMGTNVTINDFLLRIRSLPYNVAHSQVMNQDLAAFTPNHSLVEYQPATMTTARHLGYLSHQALNAKQYFGFLLWHGVVFSFTLYPQDSWILTPLIATF